MEILFLNILNILKIKHGNKLHFLQQTMFFCFFSVEFHTFWAQIASILNVFLTSSFISFVQFVALVDRCGGCFVLFCFISLVLVRVGYIMPA